VIEADTPLDEEQGQENEPKIWWPNETPFN
jgi:hypothetical protein